MKMNVLFGKFTMLSLGVIAAGVALAASAQAAFWDTSSGSVRYWTILPDVATGGGTVELVTTRGEYAFPLNAVGQAMLDDIRDAKKANRPVVARTANGANSQFCYYAHESTVAGQNCKVRLWGIYQQQ